MWVAHGLMYTALPKWPPEEEKVAHPWINF